MTPDRTAMLKLENARLSKRLREVQAELAHVRRESDRCIQHLTRVYVAAESLQLSLELEEVLRCLKEIVINLIGSETFGIYDTGAKGQALRLLAHEGLESPSAVRREGDVARALDLGQPVIAEERGLTSGEPLVSIPLRFRACELGAILIYRLVDHKPGLDDFDREFIALFAGQASRALYLSRLQATCAHEQVTLA
ncbi:MAG: GAF domain-containing protein [Myxococcales bacterium]